MRSGDWICTYTGKQWYVTDPHPDDVDILDIAHGLSRVCRYGGHTSEFYSVAQHCIHCAETIEDERTECFELALYTLLHDASEAYIGDVVRPLKYQLPQYLAIEERTMGVIHHGLALPQPLKGQSELIKEVDDRLLMTERRDFMSHDNREWNIRAEPLTRRLTAMSCDTARAGFLTMYRRLRSGMERQAA